MRCLLSPARPLSSIARSIAVLACALAVSYCGKVAHAFGNNPPYAFVYSGQVSGGTPTSSIRGYTIDGATGALSAVPLSPFSAGVSVSQIVAHPSGNFLYASTDRLNVSTNLIAAFTVDTLTGALTSVPGSPYSAGSTPAITPNGKFLYSVRNGGTVFQLFQFLVDNTTGTLTLVSKQTAVAGDILAISPDGNYLYASDGPSSAVYSIDSSTGALTKVQSITGCGGIQMAIDGTGRFLYGIGGGQISACLIDSTTGMLSVVSGSPFGSNLHYLATHPSGAFLYAIPSDRTISSNPARLVYGYTIDQSTGALVAMQHSPFALPSMSGGAAYPSEIAIDPQGKLAYVTELNNGVASYLIDASTGELSLMSSSFTGPPAGPLAVLGSSSSSNPTLVSLSLSPTSQTDQTNTFGKQVQFTLSGSYSDGSTRFLTNSASWSSTDPSVATVANGGLATEKGYGDTTIGAAFGGLSATASLTVEAPPLVSITVTPATPTIHAGTAIDFHATGNYGDGSMLDLTNKVAWQSLTPSAASIDATGLALAKAPGSTTITATYQDVTGSATLTVVSPITPSDQFGHFVYAGVPAETGHYSTVWGYPIDGATGAVGSGSGVSLSQFSKSIPTMQIVAHPSGNFLYAGTDNGVIGFTVDYLTGGLTPVPGSPFAGGSALAITPDGKFLYASSGYNADSTAILGFAIDSTTGALTQVSQHTSNPEYSLAIGPDGKYLYASYSNMVVYSIDSSTGALTHVQSTYACAGDDAAVERSGRYLYGLFASGITACQIDATTGELTKLSGSPFAFPSNFRHMAIHPSGAFLYMTVNGSNRVYGFTIDQSTGALVAMQNSPFALLPNGLGANGLDIAMEPSGKYAYISDLRYGVFSYSVDPTTGRLDTVSPSYVAPGGNVMTVLSSSQLWDPDLKWSAPSAITYGTALSATQLDATASVPGTFAYTPPAGTILSAGSQSLGVNFTPTDSAEFNSQSATVALKVNKATPSIAWAAPAAITYGAALSSKQLDAVVTGVNGKALAGTTTYSPVAGTILKAGTHTLSVTFTPTDTTDYTATKTSVSLTVNQAQPAITWASPAAITYGTPLSTTQLDAKANVPGTFVYSPPLGAVLSGGAHTLTATFTPTDTTDYNTAIAKRSISVNPATPAITWAKPANIAYGTPLSATQLDAKANVPGTFVYSPAAGTMLPLGSNTLTVTFTPTDATDYTTAKATTGIWVSPATPTITWATPAGIVYGTPLSATQLDATANVAGTFVYSPAAGTVLSPGSKTLVATFTPANTADYVKTTAKVSLLVLKATPAITWAKPANITYGTALSATQLDATANVPGTFVYSPAAGAVLSAGSNTLTVTFTPTNTADYNTAKATLGIWVYQAAPTITWPTPASITAGTALSATQLDAAVTGVDGKALAGTSTYSPAAGTVLASGKHTLTVTFTPTDSSDYKKATASVTLTVQ